MLNISRSSAKVRSFFGRDKMGGSASKKDSPKVRFENHQHGKSRSRTNTISPYSSTPPQDSQQRERSRSNSTEHNAGKGTKQSDRVNLDEIRNGTSITTSIQMQQQRWDWRILAELVNWTITYHSSITVRESDPPVYYDWPESYDHLDRARQLLWDGDDENDDPISESNEVPEEIFPERPRLKVAPKLDVQLDVELPAHRKAQKIIKVAKLPSTSLPDTIVLLVFLPVSRYYQLGHEDQSLIEVEVRKLVETVSRFSSSKHFMSRLISSILDLLATNGLTSSTGYIKSPSSMYSSGHRARARFRSNSMPRVRMPSQFPRSFLQTISKLIPPPEIYDRSTRRNGKTSSPKSKSNTRRRRQESQDSTNRPPPVLRQKRTAKELRKELKSASAPRRARITLTILSINPIVVGRFKLTPRGERKLKKLCKAIEREENRHLQDFLEAKKAKKRKTTKRRAERLAKWNLQNRFDVRQELCAGSPGFNGGFPDRGEEGWSPPDSSDDDGDLSDMIEERRAAGINFHPDTPMRMDDGTGEADGDQDTDNFNLPDPGTEVVLCISLDWQNLGVRYQRELRVVFPATSFWPDFNGTRDA